MAQPTLAWGHWKGAVNAAVVRATGLSCDDLPDWDYVGAYNIGMSPRKAAAAVIRNTKKDMGQ
jgi:hypothetical protein